MTNNNIWMIVGVALVVAVIASLIAANITGNTIRLNQDKNGVYNVYTKMEIDSRFNNLSTIDTINNTLNVTGRIYTPILGFRDFIYGPNNAKILITADYVKAGRAKLDDAQISIVDGTNSFFANALSGYGAFIVLNAYGKQARLSTEGITLQSSNGIRWCCGPNNSGGWSCINGLC